MSDLQHIMVLGFIFSGLSAAMIGANDVANSFSPAVSSGVMTMLQATIAALVMEFLGAFLVGKAVSGTIASSLVDISYFSDKPGLYMLGMLCALMSATLFVGLANVYSWPVSATHTMVGSVIGIGIAAFGFDGVNWLGDTEATCATPFLGVCPAQLGILPIIISWVSSPIVAGIFGAGVFGLTKLVVLTRSNPFWAAVYFAPFFYALVGGIMTTFIVYKGSGGSDLASMPEGDIALVACMVALGLGILSVIYVSWWKVRVDWYGMNFTSFEWIYHWVLPSRPMRAGFDATHLGLSTASVTLASEESRNSQVSIEDVEAGSSVGVDKTNVAVTLDETAALTPHEKSPKIQSTDDGAHSKFVACDERLRLHDGGVAPEYMHDALLRGPEEGFIVREMTESEQLSQMYRHTCIHGSWKERLMVPLRMLTFGIYDATGKERAIHTFDAHKDSMRKLHDVTKYDPLTESFFASLQIITSCISAFAHGSNDVSNAIGPFAAIWGIYQTGVMSSSGNFSVPDWSLAYGGLCIAVGFGLYGFKLMRTLGGSLTYHSPSRGYSIELGASTATLLASKIGIPVSTTQCLIGSTVAIGMMSGISKVNWRRVVIIFASWIVTLPITACVSGLIFSFVIYSPNLKAPEA